MNARLRKRDANRAKQAVDLLAAIHPSQEQAAALSAAQALSQALAPKPTAAERRDHA